jgi:hypothetical protein
MGFGLGRGLLKANDDRLVRVVSGQKRSILGGGEGSSSGGLLVPTEPGSRR